MDDPSWSGEATLVAEPVSAPRARAFVCRHLVEHGMAYLVDPVRLVVSELATNAIVNSRGSFTVTIACTERRVTVTVRHASTRPRVPAQVRRTDPSGRSLKIVELISSDWGVVSDEPDSQTVWAAFDHRRREPT
jgi:hypothetical protein